MNFRTVPDVATGDEASHVARGARPESARALAQARVEGQPLETITALAETVAAQIQEAEQR